MNEHSDPNDLIHSLPLASTLDALRNGTLSPRAHVEQALRRAEQLEPRLRALLPEPGRRERLEAALEQLEARGSREAAPLAGLLVGVKDIVAVEGLPMRAGSGLPPEAFTYTEGTAIRR